MHRRMAAVLGCAGIVLLPSLSLAQAPKAAPAPKPAAKPTPAAKTPVAPPQPVNIPGYQVAPLPANIAPTAATSSRTPVEVYGKPRMTVGHPCTLWDKEDIEEYRKNLKTNPALQQAVEGLRKAMDKRITEPLGVPDVTTTPPTRAEYGAHGANSRTIADLGILYAITGEAKYADYCKQMLLAYARNYPRYPHPEGWKENRYRSANDGRLTGQFLDDGFWLIRVAFGYDLVYNLPSWTPEERKLMRDDLFEAVSQEFWAPVIGPVNYVNSLHNRSALCMAGVLMAGYASDNEKLVNIATYGQGGTREKPTGGALGTHFTSQCMLPDGLWLEGAPAYQLGITSCGIFNTAETLWHHGIDMYSHENGIVKRMLDSAIALAYPDERMTIAALHDSGRTALIDERNWASNENSLPYALGYRRYRDPRYIPIVRNMSQSISMTVHSGGPSLYMDLPSESNVPPRPIENANFFSVGYGVQRLAAPGGTAQLIMEYGPSGGHGHPSKLCYDLYALGDVQMPFPGVIFPYQDPMDPKWYWTTLGNCGLTIDETSQLTWGNLWREPRGTPNPEAPQLVFAPATTLGFQRAWSDNLYRQPLVQDRALFFTPNYLADLYGVFAAAPHQYDLAWHFRGTIQPSLPMTPLQFRDPVANGYNALGDPKHATTDQPWSVAIQTLGGKPLHLFAVGEARVEIITGKGHFFTKSSKEDEFPPTIIERRTGKQAAIFGSAIDISGSTGGYVKGVAQEGSLDKGFALLTVTTVQGKDLCFTAYRPGTYKSGELETDALQAMALMDSAAPRALYLAGGKSLKIGGAQITRSEPGLACIEKTATGSYVLSNPSPSDATITLTLKPLAGMTGVVAGDKKAPAIQVSADGAATATLKAGGSVEFRAQ